MFEDGTGPALVAVSSVDDGAFDGGARVDAMCAVAREVACQQARLLAAMAAVAGGSVGLGFDADEVAFALHLPRMVAQREVALAQDLLGRLPAVFAALADGRICLARARVFSDVLSPVADDGLAREIASRFLPAAQDCTASQLRARLVKAVLAADPDAAGQRLARSVAERRVSLSANDDTTACLSGIFLPPDKAAAAFERVDAIARGLKRDGEVRTLDQLRADVFCDLLAGIAPATGPILRAGAVELLVPLATLTGQSDAPGMLAGYGPVIADIARQIATADAGHTGATTPAPTAVDAAAGASGCATAAGASSFAATTADAGGLAATVADAGGSGLAATARAAAGVVAPQPPVQWRYRVHDSDGTLLYHGTTRARPHPDSTNDDGDPAWHDGKHHAAAQRRPRLNGPQPCLKPNAPRTPSRGPATPCPPRQADETARFPAARLRAWIAARDTTCRAPGCTAPARSCDVDHTVDHADGGATAHNNLGLLCRHHHRLNHEGGFHLDQPEPGHFRWTSPTGRVYDTAPEPP